MIEEIRLNLIPNGVSPVCHVSQYDEGRQIKINLFEGINPYVIQSGDTFTLNVRKPDNTIVTTSVSGTQGNNYITISTTEQIAAVVGENLCELKITNGSTVIGTLNFIMQVERDVLADGIPSQSVIEDLDERIAEAIGDNYYNKTETDALLNEKANANSVYTKTETDDLLDEKADIDGVYEDLTSGNAEALLTDKYQEDKTPYNFRKSGGALTVGSREVDELIGGTLAFNQLVNTFSNYTVTAAPRTPEGSLYYTNISSNVLGGTNTLIVGHKYFVLLKVTEPSSNFVKTNLYFSNYQNIVQVNGVGLSAAIINAAGTIQLFRGYSTDTSEFSFKVNMLVVDLTQMFGATIADYIYSLEQSTAGAGVAWFRALFPKSYYAYNSGELMSVKTSAHKTVGFNAWDENWEVGSLAASGGEIPSTTQFRNVGYIKTIPLTTLFIKSPFDAGIQIYQFDSSKTYIRRDFVKDTTITLQSNCTYIRFRTPDVTPVVYGHDICINISGSKNGTYEPYKERIYPLDANLELRGIAKLDANNKLYYDGDRYESDGTVTRRYGIIDLGSLTWAYEPTYSRFSSNAIPTLSPYPSARTIQMLCAKYYTCIYDGRALSDVPDKSIYNGGGSQMLLIHDSAYTDAATFKTAMSGVYLVYPILTPTTEEAASYQNPQVVNTYGTEEYIDNRAVAMPVGHNTKYLWDLKQKVEQLYGIPEAPTTNGNYKLVCTVSSGTPSYSWVLDT